jgi:Cu+-exporting ATPase
MPLEPVLPPAEDEENTELKDFRRRFWWTLPFSVIVTLLAMLGHRLDLMEGDSKPGWNSYCRCP